jgi:hypothetical protein
MTLCRSRRRQVVEMHYCRLFGWAHNPKVGGSNPPPATKSKPFELRELRGFLSRSNSQLIRTFFPRTRDAWQFLPENTRSS